MNPIQLALPFQFPQQQAANDPAFLTRLYRRRNDDRYRTPEWRRTRNLALQRAHWKCEKCTRGLPEAIRLDVHHDLPVSQYPELFHVPSNLLVLCSDCHETETMKQALKYGWRYALR